MNFQDLVNAFLHLDKYLNDVAAWMGPWLYALLFLILFCETGLVVTPFLPGDSLLFAVGALAASPGSSLSLPVLIGLLIVAAVLGDAVNYLIGYHVGPRVFTSEQSRLFNKKHLVRTQEFYEKYGKKTIILARFVPIVRTFAPFVAGIGKMEYRRFSVYNITGGVCWVLIFLVGGFLIGNIEVVKNNFGLINLGIIIISVLPLAIEILLSWSRNRAPVPEPEPLTVESR